MNYLGLPKGNYFSGLHNQWSEPFSNAQNYGWKNQLNSWRGQEDQWSDPYHNGQNYGWMNQSNPWEGQENQWHSNHLGFNVEDPFSTHSHQNYGFQGSTVWHQEDPGYQENISYERRNEDRDHKLTHGIDSTCDSIKSSIVRMTQVSKEFAQAVGIDLESEDESIHTSTNEVAEEQGTIIQCVQRDVPLASPPHQQQLHPSSTFWHQEDPPETLRDQESHVNDFQQTCSNIERDLERILQRIQEDSQVINEAEPEYEDMFIHTSINEVVEEQSTPQQCVQPDVPLISPSQQQLQNSSSKLQLSSNNMWCEDTTLGSSNEAVDVVIPQLEIEDVEKVDCHELRPILEDEFYEVEFEEDATKVFNSYGRKGVHDGKSSVQDVCILARLHKIRGRVFKYQGLATRQRSSSIVVWWELKFKREPRIVSALGSSQGEVDKFQTRDIWHKGQLYHEEDLGSGGSCIGNSCFAGNGWTQRDAKPLHDPP